MKHTTVAAALAVAILAASASAAEFYGELHAGTTRGDYDAVTQDERVEGAYGLGVGVRYNAWFSTQLDWNTLGENALPPPVTCPTPPCPIAVIVAYPEHSWTLRALPRLPLGESFAIELGIGWADWEGDVDAGTIGLGVDGGDWLYSLGVEWHFGERWSVTAETQVYAIDQLDFDWTGATLRYRF
jgi:opacity protein-like surface antigen